MKVIRFRFKDYWLAEQQWLWGSTAYSNKWYYPTGFDLLGNASFINNDGKNDKVAIRSEAVIVETEEDRVDQLLEKYK